MKLGTFNRFISRIRCVSLRLYFAAFIAFYMCQFRLVKACMTNGVIDKSCFVYVIARVTQDQSYSFFFNDKDMPIVCFISWNA